MFYINSAINPILYNIMSSKFRDGFKRAFNCHKRWRSRSSRYPGGRWGTHSSIYTNGMINTFDSSSPANRTFMERMNSSILLKRSSPNRSTITTTITSASASEHASAHFFVNSPSISRSISRSKSRASTSSMGVGQRDSLSPRKSNLSIDKSYVVVGDSPSKASPNSLGIDSNSATQATFTDGKRRKRTKSTNTRGQKRDKSQKREKSRSYKHHSFTSSSTSSAKATVDEDPTSSGAHREFSSFHSSFYQARDAASQAGSRYRGHFQGEAGNPGQSNENNIVFIEERKILLIPTSTANTPSPTNGPPAAPPSYTPTAAPASQPPPFATSSNGRPKGKSGEGSNSEDADISGTVRWCLLF